jgi:hypothetical protein
LLVRRVERGEEELGSTHTLDHGAANTLLDRGPITGVDRDGWIGAVGVSEERRLEYARRGDVHHKMERRNGLRK